MKCSLPKNVLPDREPVPPMVPPMPSTRARPRCVQAIATKAVYLVALVALYFALAKTYAEFLQPQFKYMHFKQSFVPAREVTSLIVVAVAAALLPARFCRPSDLYVALAIVFTLVPTAMMYAYADLGAETAFVSYAGLAVIALARLVPLEVPAWKPVSAAFLLYLLTGITLLGVGTTAYYMGLDHFSLDLVEVYGRRAIGHALLTGLTSYIVFFALKCNLLAIIIAFVCKRWTLFVINIIAGLLFFGFLGNKGPFYGMLFFIILIYVVRSKLSIVYIISAFAAVYVLFYVFFLDTRFLTLIALFEQRMLILPVFLNNLYMTFFSDMKLLWADSKLSLGILDYPLNFDPQTTVGYFWRGKTTTHANTGFIGSGYMHAGWIGILAYAIVIGLCCRVIDELARLRDTRSFAAIICLPGFLTAVTTSDLPTVLLSGGWVFAILLVAVFDPRVGTPGRKRLTSARMQAARRASTPRWASRAMGRSAGAWERQLGKS